MKYSRNTVILLNFLPSIMSSYINKGSIYPAIAVMLIGSNLKKHGFHVKIIDGAYYESYLDILRGYVIKHTEEIIYVGMSVMTTQVPLALRASKEVKKNHTNIPIVWGGPHPTLFPEQTLKEHSVDIVSINEGSFTAVRLAEALQKEADISSVNGIGYKKDDDEIVITQSAPLENIHDLPHLDFSSIETNNYVNPKNSVYQREFPKFGYKVKPVPILTGLGCPYKCQFCINVILKRRYRYRYAESIVSEIKRLQTGYGANTFIFMDEDFFINKRRSLEFVSLVEKENLHFNWRMWCRVDHFNESYINHQLLKRLDRIGYGSMVMGGESGNQEILDRLKKQTTTEQILNSLKMLEGSNITPRYSFMVGLEDETLEQIKNTFNFIFKMKKIRPDVDIAPFIFRLYPGSPIYNRLIERFNIKTPRDLESWEPFLKKEDSFTEMPWTPKKFQKNTEYISFYMNNVMPARERIQGVRGALRAILAKIYQFRLKSFIFCVPIELKFVQWFLKQKDKRRMKC